jgi:2',3'-cyclic-nucleotide 2'-phosphodiesterase (5'-nucleotidase family)
VKPQTYEINAGPADASADSMISPYKNMMEAQMNKVIGTCAVSLYKDKPESTLGNWMCDALAIEVANFTEKKIDFALQNHGGIRINELAPGPVTLGKVYELMPFDNMVVILEADGYTIQRLLDFIAGAGGWPVGGGLRMGIRDSVAVDVTIGGAPLDVTRNYVFVVSDYIANGGDNLVFLSELPRESPDLLVRDALISRVRHITEEGGLIEAEKDGRMRFVKK